jgi:hypothetical protein
VYGDPHLQAVNPGASPDEYFWQFCGSRGAFTRNSTEIQWLDSYLTVIIAGSEGRARQYFFFGRKY